MYVIRTEEADETIEIENLGTLESRSAELVRRLLEIICYGGNIKTSDFTVNDANRKEFYSLLMTLYLKEKKYIEARKKAGIMKAAKEGKYKGREKIQIDDSLSTFNRRYKEYKKSLS